MVDTNQYLDMFIEESKEHLQNINDRLLELEQNMDDLSVINELFRSAHTLKGMAATMGFDDLASLTHEMETVMDLIRNQSIQLDSHTMDVIFQCVDLLEEMILDIADGGNGELEISNAITLLRQLSQSESPVKTEDVADEVQDAHQHISSQQEVATTIEQDMELNEYEISVIKESLHDGYQAFSIHIELADTCMLKAARAYMVFDHLDAKGEILRSTPTVEELEEEKFDRSFEILYLTTMSREEVERIIMSISEIEAIQIVQVQVSSKAEETKVKPVQGQEKEESNHPTSNTNGNGHPKQRHRVTSKSIRVDIERLDSLMNLFSEMVIDRGRLEQISSEMNSTDLQETVEHMSRISTDLQNIILTMRMVPVEQVFNRFPRMVRDLAKELNKNVNLEILGEDTELDRTVIDEIGDPLVHLLRNSLDHGVEDSQTRLAKGKPEVAIVRLSAYHSGNHVFIEVYDDGAGIDAERVKRKAIEKGIIDEKAAEKMTEEQAHELLFASGLSTSEKVTDVSGRGVGLDVVKAKITALGGNVTVQSKLGEGTTFLIQLPLTLSIISSMLVQVQHEKYAIPLSSIIETAIIKQDQIMHAHNKSVIDFRGKIVPLVFLEEIFEIPHMSQDVMDEHSVVIVRKGEKMAGLVVDHFIGQQEIVLKSLGKYLTNVFAISGATILGDGQVALIIDCNALIK